MIRAVAEARETREEFDGVAGVDARETVVEEDLLPPDAEKAPRTALVTGAGGVPIVLSSRPCDCLGRRGTALGRAGLRPPCEPASLEPPA